MATLSWFTNRFSIMALSLLAATALIFSLGVTQARADQDPIGCTASGVGLSLTAYRSDGITPIGGGLVAAGETIVYKATLSHLGGTNCNFEGGTLSITKPDGSTQVVASPAIPVVPLVTSGSPFTSVGASYVVNYAHSGGDGILNATSNYTDGTSHTPTAHSTVGASNGISVVMESRILVDKITNPQGSPTAFDFTTDYGSPFTLTDGDPVNNSGPLVLGSYDVIEGAETGWDNTGISCTSSLGDPADTDGLNLDLGAGETITCTFTNEQDAKIIIIKQTDPDGNQTSFDFDLSYGDLDADLMDGQQDDSGDLDPGIYSVSENTPAGWNLTSAICSDSSEINAISLQAGETVTCTFTNTQQKGTIIVIKDTVPNDGTDFTFTSSTLPGAPFNLDDDGETIILSNTKTFSNLTAGPYDVAETPNGSYQTSSNCVSSIQDTEAAASLELNPGETITCTFTNSAILPLNVVKTVNTTFDRDWDWTINKTGSDTNLDLQENEQVLVNYTVVVTPTSENINHAVSGNITITNPVGNPTATVSTVTDVLNISGAAVVSCPGGLPQAILAGASLVCTYTKAAASATDTQNTATVTTTGSVPGGNDSEAVSYGSPVNETDECITVDDSNPQGPQDVVICQNTADKSLEYSVSFGPQGDVVTSCGSGDLLNVADFETNDNFETGSDNHNVHWVVNCSIGCTLTQGYWKTHNDSFKGGAPTDETWDLVVANAEDTLFFTSAISWFDIFWTAPKGNAWYNLAHQYMAAKLNILGGANPAAVSATMALAEAFFNNPSYNTPAEFAAISKKAQIRKDVITWAGILGSYNEGAIGPGHCDEQIPL